MNSASFPPNPEQAASPAPATAPASRGFSLVELLVVIAIIAILMAVLIPVVASVRTSARKAESTSLLNNVAIGSQQFAQDNAGRAPGYFSTAEMGSTANGGNATSPGQGLGAIQNVMIDLAGGIVPDSVTGPSIVRVGPSSTRQISIDLTRIGGDTKTSGGTTRGSYFVPDRKYFVPQDSDSQPALNADHRRLPTMIDSFGAPILAWQQDDRPFTTVTPFAIDSSDDGVARFYVNSNRPYLLGSKSGRLARDQRNESVLGGNRTTAQSRAFSLVGILGNRAFPASNYNPATNPAGRTAAQSKGQLMFHSAGADGVYVGRADRGGRLAEAIDVNAPVILFNRDVDVFSDFDDLMVQGVGNK